MLRRLLVGVLLLALLIPQPALASQGNLVLPTTGLYNGVQFSNLITDAIAALNTCHSGTTAPANSTGGAPAIGQCWIDTSGGGHVRKLYDGTTWLTIGSISGSTWIPRVGGGATTLASSATVDLCSVEHTYITITGTTNISSFGTSACANGQIKILRFNGSLTLTHDAATLVLQGGDDITTASTDMAIAVRATSSRWDVIYPRASSAPPPAADATPIGTMLTFGGFSLPTNYEWCAGTNISRVSFPDYLAAVTKTVSATRTNGSPTLTGTGSTEQYRVGMDIEGTGIPAGATIASKTAGTITLSANATSSGTSNITIFAWGNGNGSSTVGLPDMRGRVAAARDDLNNTDANRLTAAAPASCAATGLGQACGNQQGTLTEAQLPVVSKATSNAGAHQHTYDDSGDGTSNVREGSLGLIDVANNAEATKNTSNAPNHTHTFAFGSGDAHSRLAPTLVTNCIVKVQ